MKSKNLRSFFSRIRSKTAKASQKVSISKAKSRKINAKKSEKEIKLGGTKGLSMEQIAKEFGPEKMSGLNETEALQAIMRALEKIKGMPIGQLKRFANGTSKRDITDQSLPILKGKISEISILENFDILNPFKQYFHDLEVNAIVNADVSNTIYQKLLLANSGLNRSFPGTKGKRIVKNMNEALDKFHETVYLGRGIRAYMMNIMYDLLIFGAISSEAEVSNPPTLGIKELWRVPNDTIKWRLEADGYNVYQQSPKTGITKKLNPLTYIYNAILSTSKTPYGIPPYLPSLDTVELHKKMMSSFVNVIKRYGVMGLVTVLLDIDNEKEDVESDEDVDARIQKLYEETAAQLEKNLSDGVMIGTKDSHQFTLSGNNFSSSGLSEVYRTADIHGAASRKTSPAFEGRDLNATDTFGRVILEVLSSELSTLQDKVLSVVTKFDKLHLRLLGYNPRDYNNLKNTLDPSTVRDSVRSNQAANLLTDNVIKKVNAGFIDNTQAANELGYREAYRDSPPPDQQNASNPASTNIDGTDNGNDM